MTKYSVGLDIGIASCGWSVVDIDKKEIVDLGSRIFPSGNAAGNQDRRNFRGTRRLIRRRENRLSDLMKLLAKNNFPVKFDEDKNRYVLITKLNNVYELRVNGLTDQLSKEELTATLYHLVNRRGISYKLSDSEDETISGYGKAVSENQKLLDQEKTVGQIQLERLENHGQVRGQVKTNEETTLLNVFPASAYADEARQILTKQQEFYPEITNEFIEKIVELITRKRDYFIGPGNEKSRTDYGIYKMDGRTLDNLFDELIGNDILGEKRASASSLTAQIYNLFNDLNNLKVKEPNENTDSDGKLLVSTKKEILYELRHNSGKNQLNINQICKLIGTKSENIDGFRIKNDDSKTKLIHNLKAYDKFRKALAEISIEANELPTEFFDKVADILTLNTEKSEIRKQLDRAEFADISDEIKELIIGQNKNLLVDGRATWHSFSYKTLKILIPELLNTNEEQMTILTRLGMIKPDNEKYKGLKNVPAKKITEEIYNPVVAKSTREAINVFNAIAKRYGRENIEHVVIELPREDNEDDVKKNIQKYQKAQEAEKNAADEFVKQQLTISDSALLVQYRKFKGLSQKVRFWYQQEGICPYCGQKIEAVQLINNNDSFEVDHIIPISVSFDDSQNNKVLVHAQCNQEKVQQTPLGWINSGGGFGQNKTAYIAKVKANKLYNKNKIDNLLSEVDLNDLATRRGFIQRNLNDTRYASRTVLNEFYNFFKSNDLPTKVKVVRGKWTSQMRKKWNSAGGLAKTRDTHHHHAIDASIIASFPLLKAFDKAVKLLDIDQETGEILKDKEQIKKACETEVLKQWAVIKNKDFEKLVDELYNFPLFKQVERANDIGHFSDTEIDKDGKKKFTEEPEKITDNPVKFSHKVDKKPNRVVANQTIYSARKFENHIRKIEENGEIQDTSKIETLMLDKISDIYSYDISGPKVAGYKKFKELYDKEIKEGILPESSIFLMRRNDSKTFEKLEQIMGNPQYSEDIENSNGKVTKISPFERFRKENGYITKYTRKDNGLFGEGVPIKSLKFLSSSVFIEDKSEDSPKKSKGKLDITPKNAKEGVKVYLDSLNPWRTDLYWNDEKEKYEFLFLRQSDISQNGEKYFISQKTYDYRKKACGVTENSKFTMSLYRNERIEVSFKKDTEKARYEFLFWSGGTDAAGKQIELKPVHQSQFIKGNPINIVGNDEQGDLKNIYTINGQWLVAISGLENIVKINTDILGTPYPTEKEELKLTI